MTRTERSNAALRVLRRLHERRTGAPESWVQGGRGAALPAGTRLACALLALGALLGACQRTSELPVTSVTYLGVPLDLVRQEPQPRTSYGDAKLFLVVRCAASGRVVLRQSFFPGPEWAVLKTPGRITATRDGLTIRGADPEQTVVIRPAQVTHCTQ